MCMQFDLNLFLISVAHSNHETTTIPSSSELLRCQSDVFNQSRTTVDSFDSTPKAVSSSLRNEIQNDKGKNIFVFK